MACKDSPVQLDVQRFFQIPQIGISTLLRAFRIGEVTLAKNRDARLHR